MKTKSSTEVYAVTDGKNATAEIKSLHVMLLPDDGHWFAQGLEIDYAACGETIEQARENFAHGLAFTVCEHLMMHGNLDKVLNVAPKEAWLEYYNTPSDSIKKHALSFVTSVKVFEDAGAKDPAVAAKAFPFSGMQFLKGTATADAVC